MSDDRQSRPKDRDRNRSNRNSKRPYKGGEEQAVQAHEPIQAQPLEVKVFGNNFDKALRAFRALVQKERVLSSFKERQSYEKPSDKKRRKKNESVRKQLELDSERTERPRKKKGKRKA